MKIKTLALILALALLLTGCGIDTTLRAPQAPTDPTPTPENIATPTPHPTVEIIAPSMTPTPVPTPTPEPVETYPLVYTEPSEKPKSPYILVRKEQRVLELYDGDAETGVLIGRFAISLGTSPIGPKEKKGDNKTPEGMYYVTSRNEKGTNGKTMLISYPSSHDADRGVASGLISESKAKEIKKDIEDGERPTSSTDLGGGVGIHAGGGIGTDWTAGNVAVENDVMDIIWKYCPKGTTVEIRP